MSIWDIAVLNIAQTLQVWLAEDSGKVTQLTFNTETHEIINTQTVYVSQNYFPAHLFICLQQFINPKEIQMKQNFKDI